MSKCLGCGVTIQYENKEQKGYSPKKDSKYCLRCFKMQNYHENIKNESVISDQEILNKINRKKIFTFFLVDLLNLNNKVISLYHKINNNKILILTKIDILPSNLPHDILIQNIKKIYDINDVILFSKENGFGQKEILNICQKEGKVLFVGPTSSGKSSLINYLFNKELTVSEYQNTTMEFIPLTYQGIKIYDAPGFNEMYPIKEYIYKKKVNPKVVMLTKEYSLYINDYVIKTAKASLSLYFHNEVKIKTKKDNTLYQKIDIPAKSDLVIPSLGFIYFKDKTSITSNIVNYEIRESVVCYHE